MELTCYISVSLNKQLVFSETCTKEESVNAVSRFVQAFNDVASTMLKKQKKRNIHNKSMYKNKQQEWMEKSEGVKGSGNMQ